MNDRLRYLRWHCEELANLYFCALKQSQRGSKTLGKGKPTSALRYYLDGGVGNPYGDALVRCN